ncbi:hypothetical protein ABPG77_002680 [Micractinium sp. CCAP 211/92]
MPPPRRLSAHSNVLHLAAAAAALLLFACAASAEAAVARGASAATVAASSPALVAAARAVGPGHGLRVTGHNFAGDKKPSTLVLERFDIFRPGAVIEIRGLPGSRPRRQAPPDTRFFRGHVQGEPSSSVMLSVRPNGAISGLAFRGHAAWALGNPASVTTGVAAAAVPGGGLQSRRVQPQAQGKKSFKCGNDKGGIPHNHGPAGMRGAPAGVSAAVMTNHTVFDQNITAVIALETDFEYFQKFGSTQKAIDYAADLIGYADMTYSREIQVDLSIGFLRLWTGGADTDPWPTATDSATMLTAFKSYWDANMTTVERTTAHFLSGMNTGGGISWVGVLCDWYNSPTNNFAYGETRTAGWGGCSKAGQAAHEIGHNFNSPHTHQYCNTPDASHPDPVDRCATGCMASAGLPTCTGPVPYYNGGKGTIMSYCYLQPGSYNNVAMTFGQNHPCGNEPDRVPIRMRAHPPPNTCKALYKSCVAPAECCSKRCRFNVCR